MTTYFVSRHPGAREWWRATVGEADSRRNRVRWVDHLDPTELASGDRVVGSLPVHVAAEVCRQGAEYLHLALEIPPRLRGRELNAEEMAACGARLEPYRVEALPGSFNLPHVGGAP